jgi:hypothetical protein
MTLPGQLGPLRRIRGSPVITTTIITIDIIGGGVTTITITTTACS